MSDRAISKTTAPEQSAGALTSPLVFNLANGMRLDRKAARQLLKVLDGLDGTSPGLISSRARIRGLLASRKWKTVHVSSRSAADLLKNGVTLGNLTT